MTKNIYEILRILSPLFILIWCIVVTVVELGMKWRESMKKYGGFISAVLVMSLLVGGCGASAKKEDSTNQKNKEETTESAEQIRLDVLQPAAYGNVQGLEVQPGGSISVIGRGSSSAYWAEVKAGALKAVEDLNKNLGYKGKDKIRLVYSAPVTEDNVDDQVNILDEELARYPIALGIAAVDAGACEVQFDLALENNIPIVGFDSGTDYQDIVCMVDTDNIEAAQTAADKLSDCIDGEGEVVLLVHDTKSTSGIDREKGFVERMKSKSPEVSIVATYHLDDMDSLVEQMIEEKGELETEPTQQDVIQYILEKHPNVKGIYTTNEATAVMAVEAAKVNEDIKIVSFDGGKDQLARLQEGSIDGLIVQNPFGIGYATVVACVRAVSGQGNEAIVDAGYTWVDKNNMKEDAIKKMMY